MLSLYVWFHLLVFMCSLQVADEVRRRSLFVFDFTVAYFALRVPLFTICVVVFVCKLHYFWKCSGCRTTSSGGLWGSSSHVCVWCPVWSLQFGCFRACALAYMPVSNQSINKSVNLAWPFTTALVSGVAASRPSQRVSSRVESRVIVFQVKSSLKFLSLCPSQVQVVKIWLPSQVKSSHHDSSPIVC